MALINVNNFTSGASCIHDGEQCFVGFNKDYYFPFCPKEIGEYPLNAYFKNLKIGAVFAYNDDSPKLIILKFIKIKRAPSILVMCEREGMLCETEGFKPWLIAKITFMNGYFIHENWGSYFDVDEAEKVFYSD